MPAYALHNHGSAPMPGLNNDLQEDTSQRARDMWSHSPLLYDFAFRRILVPFNVFIYDPITGGTLLPDIKHAGSTFFNEPLLPTFHRARRLCTWRGAMRRLTLLLYSVEPSLLYKLSSN
ncbi:hypothetical protein B0H14DRAFT_2645721 [Mycena olivaceomarginata]|nr:hypothetical protein B0H14DRAFT_2645721 [Mycena olivaceomarginata]